MTLTVTEQVRLLMGDTDPASPIFEDDEVASFLSLTDNAVMLAAAMGLDVMASKVTWVLKKVNLMSVETDGPAVAVSLRAQAKSLRQQYEALSDQAMPFGTAEFADDAFQRREFMLKQILRGH